MDGTDGVFKSFHLVGEDLFVRSRTLKILQSNVVTNDMEMEMVGSDLDVGWWVYIMQMTCCKNLFCI